MSCDFGEVGSSEDLFSFGQPSSGGGGAAAGAAQTFAHIRGFISFSKFTEEYRFDETVPPHGSGTFGKVYLGVNKETGLPVALKKINSRPTLQNPKCSLKSIIREAKTAMLFDSPHLCKVCGFSVDDAGFVYIVMELIPGVESFEYFNDNLLLGKTNPLLVRRILLDIARGLVTLHAAGYAHRDIKFDNFMLEFGPSGEFKRAVIIDFGFTMRVTEIPHGSQQGSICYSAPEIVQNGVLSEKVDIWAFGVMLFVLLHGYYPIWSNQKDPRAESREVYQKLQKLRESPELPLYTEGNKDVNLLRVICARCLGFHPSARISAEELITLLEMLS
jgi:serine/threonine protein kinase